MKIKKYINIEGSFLVFQLRVSKELRRNLRDPLLKNAYLLILSSITSAGSGFFFWLIVARLYSAEDVGLASAIISVQGLIAMLSLLGFDISLVRFLPERNDRAEIINTCMTLSLITSILLTVVFIALVDFLSPSLIVLRENYILLFLFLVYTTVAPLTILQMVGIFAGLRRAEYSFIQTLVTITRIGIAPFLTAFGAVGIYASYSLTSLLAFIIGMIIISRILNYKPIPVVKREVLNDILHFALGNYLARIFEMLPTFILPIIVINVLGAEQNAYFFIAWQTLMLLLAIPRFTSISLLAEGSYNIKVLERNVKKALKFIFVLLGLAVAGILLFGKHLLLIFGESYAKNSFELLSILILGSIPFAINVVYASFMRVKRKVKPVVGIYGSIAIITIVLGYLLIHIYGIEGIGFGWLIANMSVIVGIGMKKIYR